jgi:A/G-specific adenine glycosylase
VVRNPDKIRELLHPLGLRWRVENLVEIADALVSDWGGKVPQGRRDLASLPGVGDYVADAVQIFAYGQRAVLVDSNTARIASRVFGLPTKWTSLRNLSLRASVARLAGDRPAAANINLALLDLGGTVCLPGRPLCGQCPVQDLCVTGSKTPQKEPLIAEA